MTTFLILSKNFLSGLTVCQLKSKKTSDSQVNG
jgi:hypothetical protein